MFTRPVLWSAFVAVVLTTCAAQADEPPAVVAQRVMHWSRYVAADYPNAVRDGVIVSQLEYDEQLGLIDAMLREAARAGVDEARYRHVVIEARNAIVRRAPDDEVAACIAALEGLLIERHRVDQAPPGAPDLKRGAALYKDNCAACHGARGRADGDKARELRPPPVSFVDPTIGEALSPANVADAVRFGILGTAMAGFPSLDEAQRWDVGFFVMSLRHTARDAPAAPRLSLEELGTRSDGDLLDELYAAGVDARDLGTMVAALRTERMALLSIHEPLVRTRAALFRAEQALWWGDRSAARGWLTTALRDGAFPAGPALSSVAGGAALHDEIVERLLELRARVGDVRVEHAVRDVAVLWRRISAAQIALASKTAAPIAAAPATDGVPRAEAVAPPPLRIFARGAWLGLRYAAWPALGLWLVATSRRRLLPWVGAAGGFVILLITPPLGLLAFASLAAVVLLAMSLRSRSSHAALALVLTALAAAPLGSAVRAIRLPLFTLGAAAAWAVLALAAVGLCRLAEQLPPRARERIPAVAAAMSCSVFAGHAIAALQALDVVSAHVMSWRGQSWLGVYPTIEGCAAQLAVLLSVAAVKGTTMR